MKDLVGQEKVSNWGELIPWKIYVLKDYRLWGGPTLEQGKSTRRKEWQGGSSADHEHSFSVGGQMSWV